MEPLLQRSPPSQGVIRRKNQAPLQVAVIGGWKSLQSNGEGIETIRHEAYSGILSEFLEVAIHLILYIREVHPPVLFQRRRKYNITTQMCAHPEYIRNGIRPLLEIGQVDYVSVTRKINLWKNVFETKKKIQI